MFYVSKVKSKNVIYVTDTKDNITEVYTYDDLKEISNTGVCIHGFRPSKCNKGEYTIGECKVSSYGVLFETSREENTLYIFIPDGTSNEFSFSNIRNDRNDVYIDGSISIINNFSDITMCTLLSLNAWVKYDIEFCGKVFILVSGIKGYVIDYTDVLFINDGDFSDEEIASYGEDCPNFITSDKIPIDLKKGIFKGKKYH